MSCNPYLLIVWFDVQRGQYMTAADKDRIPIDWIINPCAKAVRLFQVGDKVPILLVEIREP
jgi:hypothetical protein